MAEPGVMVAEKRMTRDDKRALEKVIVGDFTVLQAQVRDAIDKEYEIEKAELTKQYASDKQTTDAARKVRTLMEKHKRAMEDLLSKLREEGVVPQRDGRGFGIVHVDYKAPQLFESSGRTEAFGRLERKYNEIRTAAQRSIERDKLAALRTLALAGITSEVATELLNSVSSPETVFARAAAAAAQTQTPQIAIGS